MVIAVCGVGLSVLLTEPNSWLTMFLVGFALAGIGAVGMNLVGTGAHAAQRPGIYATFVGFGICAVALCLQIWLHIETVWVMLLWLGGFVVTVFGVRTLVRGMRNQ